MILQENSTSRILKYERELNKEQKENKKVTSLNPINLSQNPKNKISTINRKVIVRLQVTKIRDLAQGTEKRDPTIQTSIIGIK